MRVGRMSAHEQHKTAGAALYCSDPHQKSTKVDQAQQAAFWVARSSCL